LVKKERKAKGNSSEEKPSRELGGKENKTWNTGEEKVRLPTGTKLTLLKKRSDVVFLARTWALRS